MAPCPARPLCKCPFVNEAFLISCPQPDPRSPRQLGKHWQSPGKGNVARGLHVWKGWGAAGAVPSGWDGMGTWPELFPLIAAVIALEQQQWPGHRRSSGLVNAFLIGWGLSLGLLYLWISFSVLSSGLISLAHCFSLSWQGSSPAASGIVVCCHSPPCTLSSSPLGFWQRLNPESTEEY